MVGTVEEWVIRGRHKDQGLCPQRFSRFSSAFVIMASSAAAELAITQLQEQCVKLPHRMHC